LNQMQSKGTFRDSETHKTPYVYVYVSFSFTDKSTKLSTNYFPKLSLFRGLARSIEGTQNGWEEWR